MDFFAIVEGRPDAIYRMELHQELQIALTDQFNQHAEKMVEEGVEVLPFTKENFKPDDSEILEISPFDLPEFLFDPLQNAVGWDTLPLDVETLSKIYCVFSYDQDTEKVIFQVIPKTQRLTSSFNLILSNNVFKKLDAPGLILSNGCHAIYQDNTLRFKSIWWLKQIIDITAYYTAATSADVTRFAELNTVKVEDLASLRDKSGQWVRTRLAYILDSGVLATATPQELAQKAATFGINLRTEDENGTTKLLIPQNSKELRTVLKFLEEEYYAGPITGEPFEANSKRKRVA